MDSLHPFGLPFLGLQSTDKVTVLRSSACSWRDPVRNLFKILKYGVREATSCTLRGVPSNPIPACALPSGCPVGQPSTSTLRHDLHRNSMSPSHFYQIAALKLGSLCMNIIELLKSERKVAPDSLASFRKSPTSSNEVFDWRN